MRARKASRARQRARAEAARRSRRSAARSETQKDGAEHSIDGEDYEPGDVESHESGDVQDYESVDLDDRRSVNVDEYESGSLDADIVEPADGAHGAGEHASPLEVVGFETDASQPSPSPSAPAGGNADPDARPPDTEAWGPTEPRPSEPVWVDEAATVFEPAPVDEPATASEPVSVDEAATVSEPAPPEGPPPVLQPPLRENVEVGHLAAGLLPDDWRAALLQTRESGAAQEERVDRPPASLWRPPEPDPPRPDQSLASRQESESPVSDSSLGAADAWAPAGPDPIMAEPSETPQAAVFERPEAFDAPAVFESPRAETPASEPQIDAPAVFESPTVFGSPRAETPASEPQIDAPQWAVQEDPTQFHDTASAASTPPSPAVEDPYESAVPESVAVPKAVEAALPGTEYDDEFEERAVADSRAARPAEAPVDEAEDVQPERYEAAVQTPAEPEERANVPYGVFDGDQPVEPPVAERAEPAESVRPDEPVTTAAATPTTEPPVAQPKDTTPLNGPSSKSGSHRRSSGRSRASGRAGPDGRGDGRGGAVEMYRPYADGPEERTPLRARLEDVEPRVVRRDSSRWGGFDAGESRGDSEPQDTLSVVLRRKSTVVLVAVITALTAFGASNLQTPVYRATAELLLQSRRSEQIFTPESPGAELNRFRIATERQVMKSRSVRDRVTEELGKVPKVSINAIGETDVLSISAESTDAADAARIVNTYAETYISTRRQQVIDDLFAAGEQVQVKMTEVNEQLRSLDGPIAELEAQIAAVEGRLTGTDSAAIRQATADRARLGQEIAVKRREADSLRAQRDKYEQQLDQLQLASNLTQTGGAQIVSRAVAPPSPVRPTPVRNAVIALFIGLMLGVGAAILRDRSDNTVRTESDLVDSTRGLTVLATIPSVAGWRRRSATRVVALKSPRSRTAEAYRALRTSLQFGAGVGMSSSARVIQVTSSGTGEGKSTTVANLGVTLALTGQRVTMVCCDLRRPRLHEFFGLTNTVGLSSVVMGQVPLSAAIQTVGFEGRLALVSSGPTPSNPSELLASQRAADIIRSLLEHSDIVLIDSAPVLPVTDSVVLARIVDTTILVVRANRTTRTHVRRAVSRLRHVDAPLIGTVLNQADTEIEDSGGYYEVPSRSRRARSGNGLAEEIDPAAPALQPHANEDSEDGEDSGGYEDLEDDASRRVT